MDWGNVGFAVSQVGIDLFQKKASSPVRHCMITCSEHLLDTGTASAFGEDLAQLVLDTSADFSVRRKFGSARIGNE